MVLPRRAGGQTKLHVRTFDVRDFGAVGDGITLDSPAIQHAIDAAAAASTSAPSRVIVPGGRRFLVGSLTLRSRVDLHLADDAELMVSVDPAHYAGGAVIQARDATGVSITGTGNIRGRAREFMTHYDEVNEWWRPGPFRPRLFSLTGCRDLEVRDLSFSEAPSWGLHLLGCERVLVDGLRIRNLLDVPNCDGIDPDHCRDVEIRNCRIACGDDAIVIKTTRQTEDFGPAARIHVHDCEIATQDSALKIGTETWQDVRDIVFERCRVTSSGRACTIQLRDAGNVSNVEFRDIEFVSQYFSDPWWGRGEPISLTALPREPGTKVGTIRGVRVRNVTGRAENSVRVSGTAGNPVRDVTLENVAVTLDRWSKYPGGVFDNRPTRANDFPALEPHGTPGFHLRDAADVSLKNCRVAWGENCPGYFSHALEAENVANLRRENFVGLAAHPSRDDAVVIRST